MNILEEKTKARNRYRAIRRGIPPEKRDSEAERAANRLFELDFYQKSDKILVYASFGEELDTSRVIQRSLHDGKQVYVPRCDPAIRGAMTFHWIADIRELVPGMFGIPEPLPNRPVYTGGGGLCIVPGLAFTGRGERLGYGGGYYDRFLQSFSGLSVGLCYQEQLADRLPTEERDQRVQIVMTPGRPVLLD